MRVLEIEKLFENESELNKVIDKLQDDFEQIDSCAIDIRENTLNNPEEIKKTLNILTGIYMNLRPVLGIANTKAEILPERFNFEILKDLEKNGIPIENGQKINFSTTYFQERAKREARAKSENYIRIQKIIEGYTVSCDKSISVLQSQLAYLKKEFTHQQGS